VRRWRNWLAAGGLLAAAVILAFGAMEIFARLVLADGTNLDLEMWRYAKDLKRVSPYPGVGHEHVPNAEGTYMGVDLRINAHKLRDHDYGFAKPKDVVRVVMLGDSLMLGWGAPFDDTTPKRLEKLLNGGKPAPRYQVINTGVGNYNTAMEVSYFLAEGYRYEPDVVVLNYFINDAEPTPARKRSFLLERSYAAVVIAGALDTLERIAGGKPDWKAYYSGLYADDAEGWKVARKTMAELAAYCRAHGIGLLVASYPELHEPASYPFAAVTAKIAAAAAGAPFIDLLPTVADVKDPQSLWVTATDAHPNGDAAGRYAARLAEALHASFPGKL
jgi:lysophospholipase L1-like esterase